MQNSTTVRVVTDLKGLLGLESQWSRLWSKSVSSSLFNSFKCCRQWWDKCRKEGDQPYVLLVESGSGLLGLAPFYRSDSRPRFSATSRLIQFIGQDLRDPYTANAEGQDLLIHAGYETTVITALADFMLSHSANWAKAVFKNLEASSALMELHQCITSVLDHSSKPVRSELLSLSLKNCAIENSLDRWEFMYQRHLRLLRKSGAYDLVEVSSREQLFPALHSLVQLECTRQRKQQMGICAFDSEKYMGFYESICDTLSLDNSIRFFSLTMEGRLLAAMCWFVDHSDNTLHCHHLASVKGDGIRFSPELILLIWALKKQDLGAERLVFHSSIRFSEDLMAFQHSFIEERQSVEWFKSRRVAYIMATAKRLSSLLTA